MIISDIFPLTQSKQFDLKPTEEVRVDLVLKKRPQTPKTKLTGKVTTGFFKPVNKATVKVLDKNFNPVAHTITDTNGIYIFENVLPPGEYKLTAAAENFKTAQTIDFTLRKKITETINIILKEDPSINKGFIYGLVIDNITNLPIPDATLILMDTYNPIAETSSNAHGQYLFCNITPGKYSIIVSKIGYFNNSILVLVEKGQIIKINIQLDIKPETSLGTVSGLIKDETKILKNACVGLYKIEEESETLIQTKTTNNEGLYLFTDVEPGQYVVKAKLESGCIFYQEYSVQNKVKYRLR